MLSNDTVRFFDSNVKQLTVYIIYYIFIYKENFMKRGAGNGRFTKKNNW